MRKPIAAAIFVVGGGRYLLYSRSDPTLIRLSDNKLTGTNVALPDVYDVPCLATYPIDNIDSNSTSSATAASSSSSSSAPSAPSSTSSASTTKSIHAASGAAVMSVHLEISSVYSLHLDCLLLSFSEGNFFFKVAVVLRNWMLKRIKVNSESNYLQLSLFRLNHQSFR